VRVGAWDDKVWYSAVCYGEKTEMRGHVHRVLLESISVERQKPTAH